MPFICLLRGINVSGQKIIVMADLKKLFEKMGFTQVKTYIQSGNIVFTAPEQSVDARTNTLEQRIKAAIADAYGFDVSVLVLTSEAIASVLENCPYSPEAIQEGESLYFTLLSSPPASNAVEALYSKRNDIDDFVVTDAAVYILCRKGYGDTQFSNTFIEKMLKVSATTRNLNTMRKLLAMAADYKA